MDSGQGLGFEGFNGFSAGIRVRRFEGLRAGELEGSRVRGFEGSRVRGCIPGTDVESRVHDLCDALLESRLGLGVIALVPFLGAQAVYVVGHGLDNGLGEGVGRVADAEGDDLPRPVSGKKSREERERSPRRGDSSRQGRACAGACGV
jgi:hypothetical protein